MQTSAYEHFNDTHLHMVGMQTLHTKCCGAVCAMSYCGVLVEAVMTVACTTDDAPNMEKCIIGREACMV